MKRLLLLLSVYFAFICATVKADILVGYDGPCDVYYRPAYGYYEVCDGYPAFLGYNWGTWGWQYGWNGWPGGNWRLGNWNRGNNWNGRNWTTQGQQFRRGHYGQHGWDGSRQWHGGQHGGQNRWQGHRRGSGQPSRIAQPKGGHPHGNNPHGH